MTRYTFFVGSTDWYDAHTGTQHADAFPSLTWWRENVVCLNLEGVWEGTAENVLSISVPLESDAIAQRIAYAVGRRTANDAVLVVRDATPEDDAITMGSVARFRASAETRTEGNRTLAPYQSADGGEGWALVPDIRGQYAAFLVWADATVTPVS